MTHCREPGVFTAAAAGDALQLDAAIDAAAAPRRFVARSIGGMRSRAEVLQACTDRSGWAHTALAAACLYRDGGAGPRGWAGCVRIILQAFEGDLAACAAYINWPWADRKPRTALHCLVYLRRSGDACQLAAVAALLAHGADARAKDEVSPATLVMRGSMS